MKLIKSNICYILALCFWIIGCGFNILHIHAESEENKAVQWMIQQGYLKADENIGDEITALQYVEILEKIVALDTTQGSIQAGLQAGWFDWDELPPTQEKSDLGIQKQLAVKILMKALLPQAKGEYQNEAGKMKDLSSLNGRYFDAVFAAYANEIVESDQYNNFSPTKNITKEEASIMIYRAYNKVSNTSNQIVEQTNSSKEETSTNISINSNQENEGKFTLREFGNRGGVEKNGWLSVDKTQLRNEYGHAVVLKGMSTHGLQWFPEYTSKQSIENTKSYGANVFRIAMYVDEEGYRTSPEQMKQRLIEAVNTAIALDMYVVIDFHTLTTNKPMEYVEEAKTFFKEMAQLYGNNPAVIYEICNEFYGDVTWSDIKPYAEEVINTIRTYTKKSIIFVGTSTWGQDIHQVKEDPLQAKNIMYTSHFYAGTHHQALRDKIIDALSAGLPICISEWGVSAADGNGGTYEESAQEWMDFMNAYNLSWMNWSLCDKEESSAALKKGTSADSIWKEDDFSDSGKFVFSHLD